MHVQYVCVQCSVSNVCVYALLYVQCIVLNSLCALLDTASIAMDAETLANLTQLPHLPHFAHLPLFSIGTPF